jgi:lysozyme
MMKISPQAESILKGLETGATPNGRLLAHGQPALETYLDIARIPTNGWGHTGPDVRLGQKITLAAAEANFDADKAEFERTVFSSTNGIVSQGQFDAMVLLAFNIGVRAFRKSSVLKLHNKGDYAGAARSFGLWNKATVNGVKRPVGGLTSRRATEAALYLSQRAPEPVRVEDHAVAAETCTRVTAEAPKPMSQSTTLGSAIAMGGVSIPVGAEAAQKLMETLNSQKAQVAELAGQVHHLAWMTSALAVLVFILSAYIAFHRFAERRDGVK